MITCDTLRISLEHGKAIKATTFCKVVFPGVSRTFAINVGKLPRRLSFQVLISYLLCRIADTIEDDPKFTPQIKAELLESYTKLLLSPSWLQEVATIRNAFHDRDRHDNEILLVQNCHYVLECFQAFPTKVREHIARWVSELALGMKKYALRKSEASSTLTLLSSWQDLDEYCYYVAGTVGHLLTGLFGHYHPSIKPSLHQRLEEKATSFGIGLQMTNIIKDSIVDAERGWCYLPVEVMKEFGLSAATLLSPEHRQLAQDFMFQVICKAKRHLDDAFAYSCLLPKRAWRARIFCFLPLFMAILTLEKSAYNDKLFDSKNPVKISRQDVKNIISYTYFNCWSNKRMQAWYDKIATSLLSKGKKGTQ